MYEWLNEVYELIATNTPENFHDEKAVDLIFDHMIDLRNDNKHLEIDEILPFINIEKLSIGAIICVMSTLTLYEKENLKNWKSFYDNCKTHLLKTESEERVKRLINGFDKPTPTGVMNLRNWFRN